MSNGLDHTAAQPRSLGRSLLAILAGFVAVVVLSVGTDLGLHAVGLWPSLGQSMSGQLLVFATVYRALIVVALPSAWVGGRLRLTQLGGQAAA